MNYAALLIIMLLPSASWAGETLKTAPDLAIGSMLASLLLVIACIFLFAWLLKKSNLISQGKHQALIKVVSRQALSSKGQVQIIEVNDKRYLIGVTEQNISLLDTFAIPENEQGAELEPDASTPFATILSKISTKRNE